MTSRPKHIPVEPPEWYKPGKIEFKRHRPSRAPIVFIHKSNIKDSLEKQAYLADCVLNAAKTNPRKTILFIGDSTNEAIIPKTDNLEFVNMDTLTLGEENAKLHAEFDAHFRIVKGPEFTLDEWIKFTFERFFFVYEALSRAGFDSYWTFDSDTMIMEELSQFETFYGKFDCTEQCGGSCMNGFVSSLNVLKGYLVHMVDLFQDEGYLSACEKEFQLVHPGWAFTEMRAYLSYKDRYSLNAFDLSTPVNGHTFDHCLCLEEGPNQDQAQTWDMKDGTKMVFRKGSDFFLRLNGEYIKVVTLNMSWLANSEFKKFLR